MPPSLYLIEDEKSGLRDFKWSMDMCMKMSRIPTIKLNVTIPKGRSVKSSGVADQSNTLKSIHK